MFAEYLVRFPKQFNFNVFLLCFGWYQIAQLKRVHILNLVRWSVCNIIFNRRDFLKFDLGMCQKYTYTSYIKNYARFSQEMRCRKKCRHQLSLSLIHLECTKSFDFNCTKNLNELISFFSVLHSFKVTCDTLLSKKKMKKKLNTNIPCVFTLTPRIFLMWKIHILI